MTTAAYVWLGAIAFFAIMEAATAGLVSLWFIGGSLAALIMALFGGSIPLQIGLFLIVSILLLVMMRPLTRKYLNTKQTPTNADRLIGMQALVTQEICNIRESGAIRVSGVEWTARSTDDRTIPKGARIRIVRMEGVKVYVEPAEVTSAV